MQNTLCMTCNFPYIITDMSQVATLTNAIFSLVIRNQDGPEVVCSFVTCLCGRVYIKHTCGSRRLTVLVSTMSLYTLSFLCALAIFALQVPGNLGRNYIDIPVSKKCFSLIGNCIEFICLLAKPIIILLPMCNNLSIISPLYLNTTTQKRD